MKSKYKPYPKYKESGVEWLGEIPERWEVMPIKYLGKLKGGAGFPHIEQGKENEELPFFKVNALGKSDKNDFLIETENTISTKVAKKLGAHIFEQKTIVFAKVGAALLLSRIRWIKEKACIDNNMMGLTIDSKNNNLFVKYAMNLVKFDYIVNPGAIPSLNESQIGMFFLALPPLQEQKAIATYLDRATQKIDTLIEKQERLITLLKEKRQALISHAVTKGLDPDAKMKDSGVEWLGEIPEGWTVVSMKWISYIYAGGTPDKTNLSYWTDGTVPWINSGEVNQFYITKPTTYITEEAYANSSAKWIEKGSLVMALAGQGKTKGMVAQLGIRTTCNQSMAAIETNKVYESRFLLWWITANYQNIRNMAGGNLRDGLNLDLLGNIPCPFMSQEEQKAIATYLDHKTQKIDTLISKATEAITLLKEKRTALISAVVTGKVDVRGEVA